MEDKRWLLFIPKEKQQRALRRTCGVRTPRRFPLLLFPTWWDRTDASCHANDGGLKSKPSMLA